MFVWVGGAGGRGCSHTEQRNKLRALRNKRCNVKPPCLSSTKFSNTQIISGILKLQLFLLILDHIFQHFGAIMLFRLCSFYNNISI